MPDITLTEEAAVRQRETLRLLTEENEALAKEAAARHQLSQEGAGRLAGALVTAGYVRAADQAKTASLVQENPEALLDIVERMAADRAAPPAMGASEQPVKQARDAAPQVKESDSIWERGFGGLAH